MQGSLRGSPRILIVQLAKSIGTISESSTSSCAVQMANLDLASLGVSGKHSVRRIRKPRVKALDLKIEWAIGAQGQRGRTDERNRALGQRLDERGPGDWCGRSKAGPVPHHVLGDAVQESVRIHHRKPS